MSEELTRLKTRFDNLFQEEGLTNIKFFIDRRPEMSRAQFIVELNSIQDTISAGDIKTIETLDINSPTRRFDDPF